MYMNIGLVLPGISVLAVILMAFAIYKLYIDDPSSTKYFISAVLAIIPIILALNFLPSKSIPYYGIVYIASAIFMALAVLYLSMGKIERGVSILKALTVLVLMITIFPVFMHTGGIPLKSGAIPVFVDSPTLISSGSKATIKVSIQDAYAKGWKYTINYGDNTTQTKISTSREVTFVHEYTVKNGSTSTSYPVSVTVRRVDNPAWWGVGYSQVTVKKVEFITSLFTAESHMFRTWKALIASLTLLPVNMMYMAPLLVPGSPAYKLYKFFMSAVLWLFMLMLFFRITSKVLTKDDPDVVIYESLKDGAIALMMIVISPFIYNALASTFNNVCMHLIKYVNLGTVYASVAGAIARQQYIPGVFDTLTIVSIMITVFIAFARYILLAMLASVIPFIVVLGMFDVFWKVVQRYINLMLLLLLSGPFIAAMLALVSTLYVKAVEYNALLALLYTPSISLVTIFAVLVIIQTAITSWSSSSFDRLPSPSGTGPDSGLGGALASNEIPEGPPEVQTLKIHNISGAAQERKSPFPESLRTMAEAGTGAGAARNPSLSPEQPNAPEDSPEASPENVPDGWR